MGSTTQAFYVLILLLILCCCNKAGKAPVDSKPNDSLSLNASVAPDTASSTENQQLAESNTAAQTSTDSTIFFPDSLYTHIDLVLQKVSEPMFKNYEKKYKSACYLDSNGNIQGSSLVFESDCKSICEAYLHDKSHSIRYLLPSGYDAGIMDLLFSPSCHQFIVYSSYDLPDYAQYYEYRAEILGFTFSQEHGRMTIQPAFVYYTKDWSIDKITWVNDHTLALKLYSEEGNSSRLKYKYFVSDLHVKQQQRPESNE